MDIITDLQDEIYKRLHISYMNDIQDYKWD